MVEIGGTDADANSAWEMERDVSLEDRAFSTRPRCVNWHKSSFWRTLCAEMTMICSRVVVVVPENDEQLSCGGWTLSFPATFGVGPLFLSILVRRGCEGVDTAGRERFVPGSELVDD